MCVKKRILDCMTAEERKEYPLVAGFLDYFPDAALMVSHVSFIGNRQHNPGMPTHWARGKSTDHMDALARHLTDRGVEDVDKVLHDAKLAWRAMANLQETLERIYGLEPPRGTHVPKPVQDGFGKDTAVYPPHWREQMDPVPTAHERKGPGPWPGQPGYRAGGLPYDKTEDWDFQVTRIGEAQ